MASSTYLRPEFVDPRAGIDNPLERGIDRCGFHMQISYFNNLSSRVTVALRNGLKMDIPTASNIKLAREFIIRVEMVFKREIVENVHKLLNSVTADQNHTLRLIRENLVDGYAEGYGSKRSIIEYAVTENMIVDAGGKLYVHDLDIAVGIPNRYNYLVHPYSVEGRDMDIKTYMGGGEKTNTGNITIEYVTHDEGQRPLFTRFSDKIIAIEPQMSMHREHGLHITIENVVTSSQSERQTRIIFIDADNIQEMEKCGFFRTYEQAVSGPSFEVAQKQKLAEAQLQLDEMKMALAKANQELETEKATIKREQVRNEALHNEIKMMTDTFKSYTDAKHNDQERRRKLDYEYEKEGYDYRSLRRKEEGELIKYLPSIILGIGAVFVALKSVL